VVVVFPCNSTKSPENGQLFSDSPAILKPEINVSIASRTFVHRVLFPAGILLGLAASVWIVCYSYSLNSALFFYDGLLGIFAFLWLGKLRWRTNTGFILIANTLILLTIGLPLADVIFGLTTDSAGRRLQPASLDNKIYSYEGAKGNPAQFAVWWNRFLHEWDDLSESIIIKDPDRRMPYRFKPSSSGEFFDSRIEINSLGFRDREFDVEKGDSFRIVALGESTTMGLTLRKDERPWPKVLEELILDELHPQRPVEVINAGVAGYSLWESLIHLKKDVLPLKPDMIISYHGYNGFHFLDDTMDPDEQFDMNADPPRLIERPSRLLQQAEYRLKQFQFKRRYFRRDLSEELFERRKDQLRGSNYENLHRELISIAEANGIKLVLLTFNMAANRESPVDIVNFYRGGFPDVQYRIQANRLQTCLLEELHGEHENNLLIDTARGLDGRHEHFFDLVHLTQAGKDKLAENIFKGIRDYLESTGTFALEEKSVEHDESGI